MIPPNPPKIPAPTAPSTAGAPWSPNGPSENPFAPTASTGATPAPRSPCRAAVGSTRAWVPPPAWPPWTTAGHALAHAPRVRTKVPAVCAASRSAPCAATGRPGSAPGIAATGAAGQW